MTADMAIRKFLKHVGVTSQREIENLVRSGEVMGGKLKLRMTLSAEDAAETCIGVPGAASSGRAWSLMQLERNVRSRKRCAALTLMRKPEQKG